MTRQDELRKMVAEATPRPWERDGHHIDNGYGYIVAYCPNTGRAEDSPTTIADADLIAQAPTLALDLAAALDREQALQAAAKRLRAVAVQETPELEQCAEVMDLDAALEARP